MPTVHWQRYTAHCVYLSCCPSGQIWQTLSRRWIGQCGACSTCAATVATQREQRNAKGVIVIGGRGKKTMRTDHDNRLLPCPPPCHSRPSCGGGCSCSCCFTCGFHALSGTSSFTCMTYVTTMGMRMTIGSRGSMKGVGTLLSRHCKHRLAVRQSIRHVHVQQLAQVTTVHCPRFSRATCNERTAPPAPDKVIC